MKKDSINLFPTRRSTLLFHMRTNIIERCTNIVFTLLENPQKKSPSFLGHLWPKSGGIRLPTSSRSLRSQCFKNETFLAISTTVDDGELYGPSQLTFFFVCFASLPPLSSYWVRASLFQLLIIMTDT